MLRKMTFALFVVLLLVGCAVANAEECEHEYNNADIIRTYQSWVEIDGDTHELRVYTVKACSICGGAEILTYDVIERGSHVMMETYDYHNGDTDQHIFVNDCMYCDYRYLRFEKCNGDIDGNGCDATK